MTPRETLRAAVVVCPVRAAAAVIRLVVGRGLWDDVAVLRADPQRVVDEEAAWWESRPAASDWPGCVD
jgi:hypothetical protein